VEKKRLNVTVSEELYEWCANVSSSMGISVPALFVVAMAQYRQAQEGIKAMGNIDVIIKKIEELEKNK
jgi:hypothetical protein